MTKAVHAESGDHHIVGIGSLRVVLSEDNGLWFAQGLEIDYAAQGTTLKDAQDRFERGLIATIHEHIRRFRSIERLLEVAPREVWREFTVGASVKRMKFSCVTVLPVPQGMQDALPADLAFPFGQIEYLSQAHPA